MPPSPFHQNTSKRMAQCHPYLDAIPQIHTHRFGSTLTMRTAKLWNSTVVCLSYHHDCGQTKIYLFIEITLCLFLVKSSVFLTLHLVSKK